MKGLKFFGFVGYVQQNFIFKIESLRKAFF